MSPRLNHVAMSVPPALLDEAHCAEIVDFYRSVFGWEEMPTMTAHGERLVLQAYAYDQFVFIVSDDDPMRCPRLDHFGLAVESKDEFDAFHDRARARAEGDERVDLIGAEAEEFGDFLKLHNFYVRFLLPLMVEVQFFEWAEGIDPAGHR